MVDTLGRKAHVAPAPCSMTMKRQIVRQHIWIDASWIRRLPSGRWRALEAYPVLGQQHHSPVVPVVEGLQRKPKPFRKFRHVSRRAELLAHVRRKPLNVHVLPPLLASTRPVGNILRADSSLLTTSLRGAQHAPISSTRGLALRVGLGSARVAGWPAHPVGPGCPRQDGQKPSPNLQPSLRVGATAIPRMGHALIAGTAKGPPTWRPSTRALGAQLV